MSSTRRLAALNQHVTVSTVAEVGEYDSHDDNHLRVNEVRLARWSSAQQAVGRRCRGVACLAVAWPLLGGCRCNGRCCYMWRYLLLPPRVPLPLLPPLPPASARCCRAPRSHSLARCGSADSENVQLRSAFQARGLGAASARCSAEPQPAADAANAAAQMFDSFQGKVALVTGGSIGIGRMIAEGLAVNGW